MKNPHEKERCIKLSEWKKLQAVHFDVLKEIGNIGAGHAATSLAQLLDRRIDMDVPNAGVVDLQELIGTFGSGEELAVCINLLVEGDAPSTVLFLLDEKSSFLLADLLMGMQPGTRTELDDMAQSALQEVGNILTGSMLVALSSMTRLTLNPSVPALAHDMLAAVLSAALLERGIFDEKILLIETRFHDDHVSLMGYFFLIPEEGSLEIIFKSLGINL
ncbi:chemotaxis protein CheC [Desulfitibacter alkalitolerans]|uniref:chemotaxis protein CheC n=1 Tax=Desulfitibacter alkalitolerans TaxID=264641 RepID=UPI0030F48929